MQVAGRVKIQIALCCAVVTFQICDVGWASTLQMRFMDVGQGDAIVLRDGERVALVDTGSSNSIAKRLEQLGVSSLEALIISHNHDDHIGGADSILAKFPVATYIDNGYAAPTIIQHRVLDLVRSKRTRYATPNVASVLLGETKLTLVMPRKFPGGDQQNNRSLVVLVEHGSFKALLTGDAEVEELNALMATGAVPDVDVLKASHHGSRNGVTPLWLQTTRPEVVVISVGAKNDYGHPHEWALRYYASGGRQLLRTDRDGDVVMVVNDLGAYTVDVERGPSSRTDRQ